MPTKNYKEYLDPKLVSGSFETNKGGQPGIYFAFESNGKKLKFEGPNAKAKDPIKGPIQMKDIEPLLGTKLNRIVLKEEDRASYGHQKHPQWTTWLERQNKFVAVITTDANPLI